MAQIRFDANIHERQLIEISNARKGHGLVTQLFRKRPLKTAETIAAIRNFPAARQAENLPLKKFCPVTHHRPLRPVVFKIRASAAENVELAVSVQPDRRLPVEVRPLMPSFNTRGDALKKTQTFT